ncbi:PepSY domain-containing protein [Azonexus sp.]|uniref:PepSY domain-containing protein n=1 Tax=Azonexus sp. TaxID=1872668 RepID=UPI0027B8ADBE|nr:PepSY domain-containing protein [Azonexus sp.]
MNYARPPKRWIAGCCAILSLWALLGPFGTTAQADTRQDHEIARRAMAAGEILPLRTVLQRLEQAYPGEVLEVELEQESGRWIYEVKLLGSDGSISKLMVNARDASLIEIKGRRAGKHEARKFGEPRP